MPDMLTACVLSYMKHLLHMHAFLTCLWRRGMRLAAPPSPRGCRRAPMCRRTGRSPPSARGTPSCHRPAPAPPVVSTDRSDASGHAARGNSESPTLRPSTRLSLTESTTGRTGIASRTEEPARLGGQEGRRGLRTTIRSSMICSTSSSSSSSLVSGSTYVQPAPSGVLSHAR